VSADKVDFSEVVLKSILENRYNAVHVFLYLSGSFEVFYCMN